MRRPALVSLAALIASCATPGPRPAEVPPAIQASPDRDSDSPLDRRPIAAIRTQIHDLLQRQAELYWRNWSRGERVDFSSAYEGTERLFTADTVRLLREAARNAEGDDRRALETLTAFVTGELVAHETAAVREQADRYEADAVVRLGESEYPFRQLDRQLAAEPSAARRSRLHAAAEPVVTELARLAQQRIDRTSEVAKSLGFTSTLALGAKLREFDPQELEALAESVLDATEAPYLEHVDALAREDLAIPLSRMSRADVPRLFRGLRTQGAFPAAGEVEAGLRTFTGLGIDPTKQDNLLIDAQPQPGKNARALCVPVSPPDDVRLSVRPVGGADEYRAFLHELGHAQHYAHAKHPRWELRQLGNEASTEAYSLLFDRLLDSPEWLAKHAKLDEETRTRQIRKATLRQLYLLRRQAAQLLFDLRWHSGRLDAPPAQAHRALMSRAEGYELESSEGAFLVESEDLFAASQPLRATLLAAQIEKHLVAVYGDHWWQSKAAGDWLRALWAEGTALSPDEVARRAGADRLSADAYVERLTRRLGSG